MKRYGLIGFPLTHSFSKKYFSEKFAREEIQSAYDNFEIDDINLLPEVIKQNTDLIGLNVTIPYKEKVIPYLDELDPSAKQIAAVNTIKIKRTGEDIHLTGYNTDTFGFKHSVIPSLTPDHKKALILGTGGASKAIKFVLNELSIPFRVVSRKASENILSYKELNKDILDDHQLIINCTPLGTFPNTEDCPDIPYQFLGKKHVLYDLVYNPETTLFMKHGLATGSKVKNGYEMLVLQAIRSYEIWNESEQ